MAVSRPRATAIVIFDGQPAAELRAHVLRGDLVILPPTPGSLALAAFTAEVLEAHFAPHHPTEAQHHLPVADFAELLGKAKHDFTNSSRSWELMAQALADLGLATDDIHADVPRTRVSTSDDFLTSGAGHQQPPHRDTWWGSPFCQLNFWGPVYPMHPDAGIDFFPALFSTPLPNTSSIFDVDDWQQHGRRAASTEIGPKDTRGIPEPIGEVTHGAYTPVLPVGGMVLFSGAQAHATRPHSTGRSRVSFDFRVLSVEDIGAGPPNIDSDCTGSAIRDFHHLRTRQPVPTELQARVATEPPPRS